VINAFEEADELNTPLLFASFDVKRAFDEILRLAWTCVPSDEMEWLMDLDGGGHAYVKSPWAQSFTSPGVPVTATTVPFFIKKAGTPQVDPFACFA
jgi:hypothetical protein